MNKLKEIELIKKVYEDSGKPNNEVQAFALSCLIEYKKQLLEVVKKNNYINCCNELPSKETVNAIAINKALKYAYANEDNYEDYVKAIEEGAEYVKNCIIKHE